MLFIDKNHMYTGCGKIMNISDYNNKIYNFLYSLILSISIVAASQLVIVLCNLSALIFGKTGNLLISCVSLGIGMFIPYMFLTHGQIQRLTKRNLGLIFSVIISIILIYLKKYDADVVIFTYTIAICEECFYRGFLQKIMEKRISFILAIIIQSFCFAILNHSAQPLLENIIYRWPAGVILTIIARKYGLSNSILVHYMHNLLV